MIQKSELRKILIEKRKAIPQHRREEAARLAFEALKESGCILSFSPRGSEIDLKPLNEYLQARGRLFIVPYEVGDTLQGVPLSEIDCILVPGLGFDRNHFRIGFGKGFYDRFLPTVQGIRTIGIGFKEQLHQELLPIDPWDVPTQELLLF
ncbi:MAG: hypothetical protein KGQ49_01780 [Verrucomicrobia bacterium]|nr:hypothetical protein [Verrucomicrobiota bacterium]MBU6446111.1 hypothetical protein [Verrucomicrobiota bacterium]MDE3047877.1 hypothetical protein [Verrucomicrobiota bacterium]